MFLIHLKLHLQKIEGRGIPPACWTYWEGAREIHFIFVGVRVGQRVSVGRGVHVDVKVGVIVGVRLGSGVDVFVGVWLGVQVAQWVSVGNGVQLGGG
jgi:hypothetical protein